MDQERGVDRRRFTVAGVNELCMSVAAETPVGLVQRDPVVGGEHVCRGQSGHATPDDGDGPCAGWTKFCTHIPYSE
ncbi:Uncharacterised protein [Mycobacteroides abscessus subsp. abscessus]|nr:Uncharacterised protein [Mycobacteroides abscessus subsp. abscessus]